MVQNLKNPSFLIFTTPHIRVSWIFFLSSIIFCSSVKVLLKTICGSVTSVPEPSECISCFLTPYEKSSELNNLFSWLLIITASKIKFPEPEIWLSGKKPLPHKMNDQSFSSETHRDRRRLTLLCLPLAPTSMHSRTCTRTRAHIHIQTHTHMHVRIHTTTKFFKLSQKSTLCSFEWTAPHTFHFLSSAWSLPSPLLKT